MSGGSPHLRSLTSLRFFAALLVVLFHAAQQSSPTSVNPYESLRFGYLGVSFFFVLSGFVLVWSARDGDGVGAFYRRRFARVWPVHALAFAVAAVLVAAGFIDGRVGAGTAAANLFLLQGWTTDLSVVYAYNGVAWSLSDEALFYALFPLLYLAFRRASPWLAIAVGLGWLLVGGLLAEALTGSLTTYSLTYTFPAYRVGEFMLGMGLALLVRDGARVRIHPTLAVAFAAASYAGLLVAHRLTAGAISVHLWVIALAFLPAVAVTLVAFARRDQDGREGWMTHPAMVRLGRWSFALYMVHELVLRVARPVMVDHRWTVVVFVALAIALSGVVYQWFEEPLEKRLRGSMRPAAQLE